MSCEQLLPWRHANKDELICPLQSETYRLHPVRRVEIPKDNSKKRLENHVRKSRPELLI